MKWYELVLKPRVIGITSLTGIGLMSLFRIEEPQYIIIPVITGICSLIGDTVGDVKEALNGGGRPTPGAG